MPGEKSLRNSRDFHRVRSTGARARSNGVTVWVAPRPSGDGSRLGLAARSRKAVERNRIRRRVRHAWRQVDVPGGRDVVVGADPSTLDIRYQELVNHLESAVSRAETRL